MPDWLRGLQQRRARRRIRRDAAVHELLDRYGGGELAYQGGYGWLWVDEVRMHARTGTKGYTHAWTRDGKRVKVAFWLWDLHVHPGQSMLVRAGLGDGPHHEEPVLYVNELKLTIPSSRLNRALRDRDRHGALVEQCRREALSRAR